MVRSGTYGNVPIYVRTTQEPGSIIYVPLAGGLMRPYERPRSGDLAGTRWQHRAVIRRLPFEELRTVQPLQAPSPPTGVPGRNDRVHPDRACTRAFRRCPRPVGPAR